MKTNIKKEKAKVETKKLKLAKEHEEMMCLCGGKPKYFESEFCEDCL